MPSIQLPNYAEEGAQYLVAVREGAVDDHTFREMARSFYAVFHAKSAFLIVTGDPREAIGVWEIEGKE